MNAAVSALQALLKAGQVYFGNVTGDFDAATSDAMWAAWRAGALDARSPLMQAARAEVCGEICAPSSDRPAPGTAVMLGGRWSPLPADLPLWVVPYHMHELRHGVRHQTVVQGILHHDAAGSARACYSVLAQRHLSTHFAVDDNGVVLQFLDPLTEVAWHAMGEVRREDGRFVEHGFNFRSVGIDISNPVLQDTAAGRADCGRNLVTEKIHGRDLVHLDFYLCQEESTLAMLKVLRRMIPTLGASYRPEAVCRGDLTQSTPGIYGHYHVARGKVDPFGFPMDRLAEVAAGIW